MLDEVLKALLFEVFSSVVLHVGACSWRGSADEAVRPSRGRVWSRVCDCDDAGSIGRSLTRPRDSVRGQGEGLVNVTCHRNGVVVADGSRSAGDTGCCDAILVRDAYHHLTQPGDIVRSLAAALKPGGRLAVIDFPPRPNTEVPEGVPANRLGHGVPPEVVQREVGAALTHVQTITSWVPTGQNASLYLLLFRKP